MTDFFTSDLHLHHENIMRFCERPFSSVSEMDKVILDNINARVSPSDTLYILGDVTMGRGVDRRRATADALKEIRCKNVFLVIGNHDIQRPDQLKSCGFRDVWVRHTVKEGEDKTVLDHFPLLEWDGFYRGSYHLHGHIHAKPEYNEKNREDGILRYDVGVDANAFAPVSWDEVKAFFA